MPNYNTQGITSSAGGDPRNLGGSEGYGNPSASSSSGLMSNTSNATAKDDDKDEPGFFESIANLFSGAGADLPSDRKDDDGDSGVSFYDSPMFAPYDGGSDNDTAPQGGLPFETTAADRALYEALGVDVPEVYTGKMGEEEPEPNLDMDVLQDALQPEPITVEEIEVKAGDTLTAIAEEKGVPVQDVIDANPQIKNPDLIRPGEKVTVPDPRFEGVPKPRGVPDSPRLSDSTVTPTDTTAEDTPVEDTPVEDTPVEIPSAVERGTAPPAKDAGLMSRPLTAEERTALSDRGPSWQKSQGLPINKDGSFDKPTMEKSLEDSGLVGKESALLKGAVKTEVGTDGPRTEDPYSLSNLEDFTGTWRQRSIDAGLLDRNGNATPLANQLNSEGRLGDTIFDVQYAGRNGNGDIASGDGSTYKGRGLVQITGRANYQAVQDRLAETGLNIDLMANPELVNDERYALPATLAMMDILGVDSSSADTMSAKTLNNAINSGADRETAQERWENVLNAASPAERAELELRDEYAAQIEVGLTGRGVDGDIGTGTKARIDAWAASKGLTPPAVTEITKVSNRTGNSYQTYSPADKLKLAIFVNENS